MNETNKHQKAEWWQRTGAYLIDLAFASLLGYIAYLLHNQSTGWLVFELVFLFNFCWGWKNGGQSLGMIPLKIKVVTDEGEPLSWGRTIWRYLAFTVSFISVIGMIWIIFDPKHQGWHDKLADTFVIKI